MSTNTNIEWCDHTFNIAWGCIKASKGCDNCYADTLSNLYGFDVWGPGKTRRTFGPAYWAKPLSWDREARKAGVRRRVFCSSMTDVFLNDPIINAEREKLWPLIAATPMLDWLILTKQAQRIGANVPAGRYDNVWLGVSVEDAAAAWRISTLQRINFAPVRFVSAEPLLGSLAGVDLTGMDWVIVGGESGPRARPMDIEWARELRDECTRKRIAFFLKQLGGVGDKRGHEKAILDGRRWTEWPNTMSVCASPDTSEDSPDVLAVAEAAECSSQ